MKTEPMLIVMLTCNDLTVKNAYEIFEQCKDSAVECWGLKEEPLEHEEMKKLFNYMKKCGKKTVLEVISYDKDKSLAGADMAVECGCDYLMGTVFSDAVNDLCKAHNIKYLPFVGGVSDRPSILEGNINDIIAQAKEYLSKGVYGIDLLAYRYNGNAVELIERFVEKIEAPVCVAGSINSYLKLDEIKRIAPWSFTIGSAFFENEFGDRVPEQIEKVLQYMKQSDVSA